VNAPHFPGAEEGASLPCLVVEMEPGPSLLPQSRDDPDGEGAGEGSPGKHKDIDDIAWPTISCSNYILY